MRKQFLIIILLVLAVTVKSQTPVGEYTCHFKLNQPGSFSYNESGEKYFTTSIRENGQVVIKMHLEIREAKTRETNYVDITGSAKGDIENGTNNFEANGNLVFSIYEKEKMDTRWDISAQVNGTVVIENGLQKITGTIEMKQDNEVTTASFTGEGKSLKIPYDLSYKLGYDFEENEKVAFPLQIRVNYKDENYTVKNATLVKVYVPNTDMEYNYAKKENDQGGNGYQTSDPNNRGAVFGPDYNINIVENSSFLGLEFNSINQTFLQMLPAGASLCYVTQVSVYSKKEEKLQQVTDTFRVKIRNHFKVYPLVNGKEEWLRAGSIALEAGSDPRYFPLRTAFRIPLGARFRMHFIDGTVAMIEYPVDKAYPDLNVVVGLGISADEGINGDGDIICKIDQLAGSGAEAGAKKGGKWAAIKLLLSSAKRVNSGVQLFDFFAASKVGGDKPIAVVKLRSVVGIVLGVDGSFLLKNYEGHPEVVTAGSTKAVPAGQEYNAVTGTTQTITADKDFDNLKQAVSGKGGGNSGGSFIDKLTGQYKYYTIGVAGVLATLLLVWLVKRKK
ncbi:MAG: hypothetical protein WBC06_10845 [Chitinophagaceae bacterium]